MGAKGNTTKAAAKWDLVLKRTFKAPRHLVFAAWVDARRFGAWWGPRGFSNRIHKFDARPGGEIRLDMCGPEGSVYPMSGSFREIVVPERIVLATAALDGAGKPLFEVLNTAQFADHPEGTELTLTLRVGKTTESAGQYLKGMKEGWTMSLERLEELLGGGTGGGGGEPGADDRQFAVSRVFEAPRELVWEAMTDPRHVAKWWGPRGFTTKIEEMDVRQGGAWIHVMRGPDGTEYPNRSVFTEVQRLERIAYSHGGGRKNAPDDVHFTATWSFDALAENRTRLTVRMQFATAADKAKIVSEYGAIEGAKQTLERLSELLPLINAHPEYVITRIFDARRDSVFSAWTDAAQVAKWFGPKGCTVRVARFEAKPGGMAHLCMRMPDGREMWGKWVFREIAAPERIVYVNCFSDEKGGLTKHPMNPTWPLELLTTVTLEDLVERTRLTLRWSPLHPTEDEQRTFDLGHGSMSMGWTGTLEQLDRHLSGRR
jgi:uncharacterized protein YndB with AHSA1/START domain